MTKDEHMLLRQRGDVLHEFQADRVHFQPGLRFSHLVAQLDCDRRILKSILDEIHAATGLQGLNNGKHHLARMRELVIGIDEQHDVNAGRRKSAMVDLAENRHDIERLFLQRAL